MPGKEVMEIRMRCFVFIGVNLISVFYGTPVSDGSVLQLVLPTICDPLYHWYHPKYQCGQNPN